MTGVVDDEVPMVDVVVPVPHVDEGARGNLQRVENGKPNRCDEMSEPKLATTAIATNAMRGLRRVFCARRREERDVVTQSAYGGLHRNHRRISLPPRRAKPNCW